MRWFPLLCRLKAQQDPSDLALALARRVIPAADEATQDLAAHAWLPHFLEAEKAQWWKRRSTFLAFVERERRQISPAVKGQVIRNWRASPSTSGSKRSRQRSPGPALGTCQTCSFGLSASIPTLPGGV